MPYEPPRPRAGALLGAVLAAGAALGTLAACSVLPERAREAAPAPVIDRNAVQGASVASLLDTLQRLVRGGPAEQAEIFAALKRDYEEAPTPSHTLRYAVALATGGHPASDPLAAQRLLRELVATPELLLPAERALALLESQRVDAEVALAAENRRLLADAERLDRERTATSSKRLQAEVEENARLRRELQEAEAKLDAIATIERNINERTSPNQGR
jgi:hypothetical protein